MFIYDRSKDPHASLDTNPPLRSAETEAHQREASGPGLYPQGQVTRLIMETAARDQEEEAGDRRVTSVRDLSLSCSVTSGNHTVGSADRTCFSFIILCSQSGTKGGFSLSIHILS